MKDIEKDPILNFTAGLVSTLKWASWIMAGIIAVALVTGVFNGLDLSDLNKFPYTQAQRSVLYLPGMAMLVLMGFFFRPLRSIIDDATSASPLTLQNAGRLSLMAKLLSAVLMIAMAAKALDMPIVLNNRLEYSYFLVRYLGLGGEFLMGLLPILLLFILARIFERGAMMQAELEGTV
jgi:hypothetical protein